MHACKHTGATDGHPEGESEGGGVARDGFVVGPRLGATLGMPLGRAVGRALGARVRCGMLRQLAAQIGHITASAKWHRADFVARHERVHSNARTSMRADTSMSAQTREGACMFSVPAAKRKPKTFWYWSLHRLLLKVHFFRRPSYLKYARFCACVDARACTAAHAGVRTCRRHSLPWCTSQHRRRWTWLKAGGRCRRFRSYIESSASASTARCTPLSMPSACMSTCCMNMRVEGLGCGV